MSLEEGDKVVHNIRKSYTKKDFMNNAIIMGNRIELLKRRLYSCYICNDHFDESRIYHYNSSTILLTERQLNVGFMLSVYSNGESKTKEIFGELEKLLLVSIRLSS